MKPPTRKTSEEELVARVRALKKKIGFVVKQRLEEFKENKGSYSELCFCILTANYTAEGGMRIQRRAEKKGGFHAHSKRELLALLKGCGHRYPNVRAEYLHDAKKRREALEKLCRKNKARDVREWLVKNVRGIGYKEASHFLRNTGFFNVAIIDKHVLSVLSEYGLIEKPKSLTRRQYLEIEAVLKRLAKRLHMTLGELDLYLWYLKTGKILK